MRSKSSIFNLLPEEEGELITPIGESELSLIKKFENSYIDSANNNLRFHVFNENYLQSEINGEAPTISRVETVDLSKLTAEDKERLKKLQKIVDYAASDEEVTNILFLTKNSSGFVLKYLDPSKKNYKLIEQNIIDINLTKKVLDLVCESFSVASETINPEDLDSSHSSFAVASDRIGSEGRNPNPSEVTTIPKLQLNNIGELQLGIDNETPRLSNDELHRLMKSRGEEVAGSESIISEVNAKFKFNIESENNIIIEFLVLPNSKHEIKANDLIDLYLKYKNDNDDENKKNYIFYDKETNSFEKKEVREIESSDNIKEIPSIYEIGLFLKRGFSQALERRRQQKQPSTNPERASSVDGLDKLGGKLYRY